MHFPSLAAVLEVVGALSTLLTAIAAVLPVGSKIGALAAKYGADLKGHLS